MHIMKLFTIYILLLFCSCKKQSNNKVTNDNNNEITLDSNCSIPVEVKNYLDENSDTWSRIDINDYYKELEVFLLSYMKSENNKVCPYALYGDFDNDENEDFAIIVKNKKMKDLDNNLSLLIFHNYKNKFIHPYIPTRDEKYKSQSLITSVIYSRKEYGILSYLEKGNICGINTIDIIYFEKSSFFVYWDKNNKTYQFLNHLDTNLCEKIKGGHNDFITFDDEESPLINGTWNLFCDSELIDFEINNNEVFISLYSENAIYINCELKKSSVYNNEYDLFFKNVESQQHYYDDKKNIVEEEISNEKSIATIKILNDKTVELYWKGLFNKRTNRVDFVDDFLIVKENNNTNPVVLSKCE